MGTKRVGLARTETLLQNLKRQISGVYPTVTALGDGIATRQLIPAECGIVTIGVVGTETAVTKGFNVDLPAPVAGLYYKFIFVGPSIANNANAAIDRKSVV